MDEQQIAEYLGALSGALLNVAIFIRQLGSDELKAKALPLLEGHKFHPQIEWGALDVVDALREEFPEEEEESEEDDSEDEEEAVEELVD